MKTKTSKREKQLEDRVAELEQQITKLQAQLLDHLTNHPWIWYTYPYTPQPTITPVPVPPYSRGSYLRPSDHDYVGHYDYHRNAEF